MENISINVWWYVVPDKPWAHWMGLTKLYDFNWEFVHFTEKQQRDSVFDAPLMGGLQGCQVFLTQVRLYFIKWKYGNIERVTQAIYID